MGITAAILKPEGTTPESSEQLMMAAIEEQMTERQVFTKVVGIGSSLLEEGLALDTKSSTWSESSVVKEEKQNCSGQAVGVSAPGWGGVEEGGVDCCRRWL